MIKVLVVEDSPTVRTLLTEILHRDPNLRVIGTAENGELAVEKVASLNPDIVTMDIHMPKMNGIEAIRKIMEECPKPIIVVTGVIDPRDTKRVFEVITAGALAVLPIPEGVGHPGHKASANNFIEHVKAMSQVKVVRRWRNDESSRADFLLKSNKSSLNYQVLAIGASTGGPLVVHTILHSLPVNLSIPVLIAQHMTIGFMEGFVDWLATDLKIPISIAKQGELARPGHIYCAPDSCDLELHSGMQLLLKKPHSLHGPVPSVTRLFTSVAETCGAHAIGVILTGMGRDGCEGMKLLNQKGAITIAQNEESSVIFGMPKEAINAGVIKFVMSPQDISKKIFSLLSF